jgi:hypothetical protein
MSSGSANSAATSALKPKSTKAVRLASTMVAIARMTTSRRCGRAAPASLPARWRRRRFRSARARVFTSAVALNRHSLERLTSMARRIRVTIAMPAMTGPSASTWRPPTTAEEPKPPTTAPAVAAAPARGRNQRDLRPLTTAVAAFQTTIEASADSTVRASERKKTGAPPARTASGPNAAVAAKLIRMAASSGADGPRRIAAP